MSHDESESESETETESDEQTEGSADPSQRFREEDVPEDEQEEIEEERERRLDPDNRPEGATVDNTDGMPEVVQKFDEEHPSDAAGTSDPAQAFRDMEVSEEEQQEMAEERERRLDPDNRPEGAEVDNTGRTFKDGEFVDDGDDASQDDASQNDDGQDDDGQDDDGED